MGERGRVRELCDRGERTEVPFAVREVVREEGWAERLGFFGLVRAVLVVAGSVGAWVKSFSLSERMSILSVRDLGRFGFMGGLMGLEGLLDGFAGIEGSGCVVVVAACALVVP